MFESFKVWLVVLILVIGGSGETSHKKLATRGPSERPHEGKLSGRASDRMGFLYKRPRNAVCSS